MAPFELDLCMVNLSQCYAVAPGESCELRCNEQWKGAPTRGTCQARRFQLKTSTKLIQLTYLTDILYDLSLILYSLLILITSTTYSLLMTCTYSLWLSF